MCKCLPKSTAIVCGSILSILILCLMISSAFICGYTYFPTNIDFLGKGPWRRMKGLEIGAICLIGLSTVIGTVFLCTIKCIADKGCGIFNILLTLCSSLIALATGIFVLVSSQVHKNSLTNSCSVNNEGIFKYFLALDEVTKEADKILCSDQCKCNLYDRETIDGFNNKYRTIDSEYILGQYKYLIKKENTYDGPERVSDDEKVINVEDCGISLLRTKIQEFIGKDDSDKFYEQHSPASKYDVLKYLAKDDDHMIDLIDFFDKIERKFDCTGWCNLHYEDDNDNERMISKYLFSDVNRGIPNGRCYEPYSKWLVKMLKALGSLILIAGFFQLIVFIIILSLSCHLVMDDNGKFENQEVDYENPNEGKAEN